MLALLASPSVADENQLQKYLNHVAEQSERFFETVEEVLQEELQKP